MNSPFPAIEVQVPPDAPLYALVSAVAYLDSRCRASISTRGASSRFLKRGGLLLAKIEGPCTAVITAPRGFVASVPVDGAAYVHSGAYLGHVGNMDFELRLSGLRGLLGLGEVLRMYVRGRGTLFVKAPGYIYRQQVRAGDLADNGRIVAMPDVPFTVTFFTPSLSLIGRKYLAVKFLADAEVYMTTAPY